MNADAIDLAAAIDAAFAALAARPAATFAKGAVRGFWHEALHPRGRNRPDVRGRINRGEFRTKSKLEAVGGAGRGRGPACGEGTGESRHPHPRPKSPLSGVSQEAYDKAREREGRTLRATPAPRSARAPRRRDVQRVAAVELSAQAAGNESNINPLSDPRF
jgi:hypothetical protein